MYHYHTVCWPQSDPYFAAFKNPSGRHARSRGTSSSPAMGFARTDKQIEQDVRDELETEPSVHAAAVDIHAIDGVVTLSGVVDGAGEQWLIESAARRIAGVRRISDQLKLYEPDITPADDDIAHDCERVLRRLRPEADYSIGVLVSKGWVTLSGNVAEGYERRIAEMEVGSLLSVIGVNSQVKVRSSIAATHANGDMATPSLPARHGPQSGSYGFSADNDRFTWPDAVHSWSQYRNMLYAAWSSFRAKPLIEHIRSAPMPKKPEDRIP